VHGVGIAAMTAQVAGGRYTRTDTDPELPGGRCWWEEYGP
jgi:hypothetical protein